jgi:hypothetical protein
MSDQVTVAGLVRKRAELAGRVEQARGELEAMLAGLAALDTTLRLFDPGIDVEAIGAPPCGPRREGAPLGMRARDLLNVLREAGWAMSAREIVARLLDAKEAGGDARLLSRATETAAASLRRQRGRGLVACERRVGGHVFWKCLPPTTSN